MGWPRMRGFAFGAALALGYAPFAAAALDDYAQCVDFATIDPHRTIADAQNWFDRTGDLAARHCQAIAYGELGAHRTAAETLLALSNAAEVVRAERASLLAQAARQWRLAGDPDAAKSALNAAISIEATPELYVERATLRADDRAFEDARADLDEALRLAPRYEEALTLRAAAHRRLGDGQAARRDALLAIEYRPVSATAWFELGAAERALGQKDAARRSFLKSIDLAPGAPSAALARGQLQDMDGGG